MLMLLSKILMFGVAIVVCVGGGALMLMSFFVVVGVELTFSNIKHDLIIIFYILLTY